METKSTQLENFVHKSLQVELLDKKIDELENRCDEIDARLQYAEDSGDELSAEFLAAMYNALTEQKLELQLERNKIEKELLDFQLAALRAE